MWPLPTYNSYLLMPLLFVDRHKDLNVTCSDLFHRSLEQSCFTTGLGYSHYQTNCTPPKQWALAHLPIWKRQGNIAKGDGKYLILLTLNSHHILNKSHTPLHHSDSSHIQGKWNNSYHLYTAGTQERLIILADNSS